MASGFMVTTRILSRLLLETANAMGIYDHPTAKGDGREELVRQFLAERVGSTFGVTKAEIVDAEGRSSPEFDIVVFDQSVASCLHVLGQRRIVRVESVAAVFEMKTVLDHAAVEQVTKAVADGLEPMRRFFKPDTMLRMMHVANPEAAARDVHQLGQGLQPTAIYEDIPEVITGVFAFRGPDIRTAYTYMGHPLLSCICVPGQYVIARGATFYEADPKSPDVVKTEGEDALGSFLTLLESGLQKFRSSRSWVTPDFHKYYRAAKSENDEGT